MYYVTDQCEYVHNTSSDLFEDIPCEEWRCPHDTYRGSECCPFHADTAPEDATEELLTLVATTDGPVRVLGARLGAVTVDYRTLDGPSNHPLDLREATIEGNISARHATFKRPVDLRGVEVSADIDFESARIDRRIDFGYARVDGCVTFRSADLNGWFDLREARFDGVFFARIATFGHGIYAENAVFDGPVEFKNAKFDDVANFCSADFGAGAVFERAEFAHNLQLNGCTAAELSSRPASVASSSIPQPDSPDEVAITLGESRFQRGISIRDAILAADVSLRESQLAGRLDTRGCRVSQGEVTVDCTGVETVSGEIETGSGISYDLAGAVVGDLGLSHPECIGSVRFENARFDGFRFDLLKSELRDNGWRIHDPEDEERLSPEQLENLYLRAKNGAKAIGATGAAAEFFIREMRYRRASHRRRSMGGDGVLDRGRSVVSWVGNALLALACGYGERPLQPLAFSMAVIVAYAGIFALAATPVPYSLPYGYLIFSIEGFVSLLLGRPDTTDGVLSFLIVSEAFVGASMVALLVFTLTRSISR